MHAMPVRRRRCRWQRVAACRAAPLAQVRLLPGVQLLLSGGAVGRDARQARAGVRLAAVPAAAAAPLLVQLAPLVHEEDALLQLAASAIL